MVHVIITYVYAYFNSQPNMLYMCQVLWYTYIKLVQILEYFWACKKLMDGAIIDFLSLLCTYINVFV